MFEIICRSILENAISFYKKILEWLDEYCKEPLENTELVIFLDVFNTSTSKILLDIVRKLEKVYKTGRNVKIIWK